MRIFPIIDVFSARYREDDFPHFPFSLARHDHSVLVDVVPLSFAASHVEMSIKNSDAEG